MKRRACIVVSSEMTVRSFLLRQLEAMQEEYDVTVVVNTERADFLQALGLKATLAKIPIARRVSPLADLRCVAALIRLMRARRFDIVHSVTPKAGLLAMVAAWAAGIPVRVHTFTGQVWATRSGLPRAALRFLDRIVAAAATATLADSLSQRDFLVVQGVVSASKVAVLGSGSISGVDAARFRPDPGRRRAVRDRLGIAQADLVLLFVGRVTRDKGVLDLARAFAGLAAERSGLRLVIVGPDEQGLSEAVRRACGTHADRLHLCAFSDAPEDMMAAADMLCLPSYREGFGSVIIEAAAAGLPAVASRIYGVVDAVVEEQTGLLHQPGDLGMLSHQLRRLILDDGLRRRLGAAARERAVRDFSQRALTTAVLDTYDGLLAGAQAGGDGRLAHVPGHPPAPFAREPEGCGR